MTAQLPIGTRLPRQPLDAFFRPRSIAVIGATEAPHAVGRTVLENLTSYPGPVYPVNPLRSEALGRTCYPSIAAVPGRPDLAVIVTPSAAVPKIVAECAAAGVPAAVVISAGFKETGARGLELEREIAAARGKMRIIGPNCLGIMAPHAGLNASFAAGMARPGKIAFLSQSGALCTAILDWSLDEMVGFSAFVSTGSMLDVGWGDLIGYLGDDPNTDAILIYMESIGEARSFLSAAREVALEKPIIVLKAGRTPQAAQAAASHTGAMTGHDAVLNAAFRRCGVLSVDRIGDLFDMAETLACQSRPKGPRLAIVTNAGGPAVLATDRLIAEGGELAALSPETIGALGRNLPAHWSRRNPVDLLGDAPPERFSEALQITDADPGADAILVIYAPQGISAPTDVAERIASMAKQLHKPLLASFMGGAAIQNAEAILNAARIPVFSYPDSAARAFVSMWRYSDNLRALYETPELEETSVNRDLAQSLFRQAHESGRTLLTETESKGLLGAYGIAATQSEVATTEDDAVRISASMGYPVVLKLNSRTITHKSDIGGVELNLTGEAAVRGAWWRIAGRVPHDDFQGVAVQKMEPVGAGFELILGASTDPQFGPVLLFGAGGQLVEVIHDHEFGLPPLNSTLARRLMERTRIYKALGGARGHPPVDQARLEQTLVRFSQLITENPRIKEIDINPLLASADRILALDARVVLHAWDIADCDLPRTVIRPYPSHYVEEVALRGGGRITLRPIRPEDEPAMVRFHRNLSDRSVHFRYFHSIALSERITHQRLARVCFVDYDRQMVLVAETVAHEIAGVGRLTHAVDGEAEFALIVADAWQNHGIGAALLRKLIAIARPEGLQRIYGSVLADNQPMIDVCNLLGFEFGTPEDGVIEASLVLTESAAGNHSLA
ncbi:MAG: bifunctional acetate--CoA ligase family protein/GNAT family N-acetyltransferase [Bryobacteraceae bacterium]